MTAEDLQNEIRSIKNGTEFEDYGFNCGGRNFVSNNYGAAIKWWERSARYHRDYQSASSIAFAYEGWNGKATGSVAIDLMQTYKWYDIAAQLKAEAIDRGYRQIGSKSVSNALEIGERDEIGKKMTESEIAQAQQMAKAWLHDNPRLR